LYKKNKLRPFSAIIDSFNIKAFAIATHSRERYRLRAQRSGLRF